MSILTWGNNHQGQLAFGNAKEALNPTLIESFRGVSFVNASCGEYHSLAVSDKGDVYFWGRTREGQHGLGENLRSVLSRQKQLNSSSVEAVDEVPQNVTELSTTYVNIPIQVLPLRQHRITQVQCGYYHCLALTEEGQIYEWGRLHTFLSDASDFSSAVELTGMSGAEGSEQFQTMLRDRRQRTGIQEEDDFNVSHLGQSAEYRAQRSIRNYYAGDIKKEEFAESEGLTNFGKFSEYIERTPRLVTGELVGKVVTTMGAGYAFSVVATEHGHLYAWGFNDKFQLGLGHRVPCLPSPHRINSLPETARIVGLSCGQNHTVAFTETGDCYSWGMGIFGQLGHGTTNDKPRPTLIEALRGKKVVSVATGSQHSVCCTDSGAVHTWGSSEYGQQGATEADLAKFGAGEGGREGESYFTLPRHLDAFENEKIISVTCGYLHNYAFSAQSIFSWGWPGSGVLGHGDKRQCLIPKRIERFKDQEIVHLVSGSKHTIAICRSQTTFAFDYKQVLNNKRFSDLVFEVQKKEIYAHQVLVGSRCPRLAAMILFHKRFCVQEGDQSNPVIRIEMKNIPYTPFLGVLHYLYTDHLRVPSHFYPQVLRLAQKFGLKHLEEQCYPLWKQKELAARGIAPSTFKEDMLSVIDNSLFADCKLIVSNFSENETVPIPTVIHAHKVILFSRCDYFRTFFQSLFVDSSKDELNLTDTPLSQVLALLPFLYAGDESGAFSDQVVELLAVSDKFLMNPLKQICEANINNSIDLSNVNTVLLLADQFSAPRLKRGCMIYIRQNWSGYESLSKPAEILSPELYSELMSFLEKSRVIKSEEILVPSSQPISVVS